jgi:hypothetical protein
MGGMPMMDPTGTCSALNVTPWSGAVTQAAPQCGTSLAGEAEPAPVVSAPLSTWVWP